MRRSLDVVIEKCKITAVILEQKKEVTLLIDAENNPRQKSWVGKRVGDKYNLLQANITYEIRKIEERLPEDDLPKTPVKQPQPYAGPKTRPMNHPQIAPHKNRAIFWVFQGKEYMNELSQGYIWAPYQDASGNEPSHWAMLENVKAGDIIIHGLSQGISAISVAQGGCFDSKIKDGVTLGRQVNCRPHIIRNTIITRQYKNEIIASCFGYKYQPFDKNGNGRMGYLFDLNDKLAGIFTRALVKENPTLVTDIPELKDVIVL